MTAQNKLAVSIAEAADVSGMSRAFLYEAFFAWRVWRYLWLAGLLAWAIVWIVYLIRKYPAERDNYLAYQNRQKYIPKNEKRKTASSRSR